MAIYKPNAPFTGISGKLLGSVFVNSRSRQVIRPRPITTKNPSEKQLQQRALFTTNRLRWRDLPSAQRAQWIQTANSYPRVNRLGTAAPLTGFQLYIFFHRLPDSLVPGAQDSPPPVVATQPPTLWDLSNITISDPTWNVTLTPLPAPRFFTEVWVARSYVRKDVKTLQYWRKIRSSLTFHAGTFPIRSDFEEAFGAPSLGETLLIRGRYTKFTVPGLLVLFPSTTLAGKTIIPA